MESFLPKRTHRLRVQNIAAVSLDVADYNQKMFTQWYAKQDYKGTWKDWVVLGPGNTPNGLPGGGDGTAWHVIFR